MDESKRIVNQEDLDSNPELEKSGVKLGDEVELSKLGTRDNDEEDTIPKPAE